MLIHAHTCSYMLIHFICVNTYICSYIHTSNNINAYVLCLIEALVKSGASKIIKISDRVHDMKAVREWIDSRPQTMF